MSEWPVSTQSDAERRVQLASKLGVFSLASGLVLCCPLAGLAAFSSGSLALYLGRGSVPDTSWRRYAWGGVGLGLLSLILGLVATIVFSQSRDHWEREGRLLYSGPNNALFALFNDDTEGFLKEFTGTGSEASASGLSNFQGQITSECGSFLYCNAPDVVVIDGPGPWELDGYQVVFASSEKPGSKSVFPCRIMVKRLSSGTLRLVWMEIQSDQAMIRYPVPESQEARQGG